jgi:amino acid transporter
MNIIALVISLVIVLMIIGLFVCSIILQIHLSKKESKWPGLILPGITLFLSLLSVIVIILNVVVSIRTVEQSVVNMPDGSRQVVHHSYGIGHDGNGSSTTKDIFVVTNNQPNLGYMSLILPCVTTFFLFNIPTAIYLAIYYGVRGKYKQKKELDKMKSLDL